MFNSKNSGPTRKAELASCLQVTEVGRRANWLELNVNIKDFKNHTFSEESAHKLCKALHFYIRIPFVKTSAAPPTSTHLLSSPLPDQNNLTNSNILVLFKFMTTDLLDNTIYSISCNSLKLGLKDKIYYTDNDSWHLVHETAGTILSFNVVLSAKVIKTDNPFKVLYEDTQLTDLKLTGEGGSEVEMHGVVLATQCPAVVKVIHDKTKHSVLEYRGVQQQTLQHFKNYVYLRILPNENLEQLLLFATRVKMVELERDCIEKIISSLSATNIYRLTEFALKHNIYELYLSILECIQKGKVKVNDVRANLT